MADTIILAPYNPQSLNRYAYCLNNPVRYTDPSGHMAETYNKDYDGPGSWDAKQDKKTTDYWGGPREPAPLTSFDIAITAYFIGIENPIIGSFLGIVGVTLGAKEHINSIKKDREIDALKEENARMKEELNISNNGTGNTNYEGSRPGDPDRSPSEEKDFECSGDSPEDLDW